MEKFIDLVIEEVRSKFGDDLRRVCIVFPTRRACLIFRNRFAATLNQPVWAPGIMGIGDFISKHATNPVSEEIPLLLTLFQVYKKEWPGEDFGKFYAWGKMLISDFDEIDKQLTDPSRIFLTIGELKKIEAGFLPDPESLKWINEFIASMNEEKLTKIQIQFSKTWNRLKHIYTEFNGLLDKKGLAYEGKAYRDIIGKLKKNEFRSAWDTFVFAGFYGLSRIEERMISELQNKFRVELLWDADPYYINNKLHEAGYYFRKSPFYSNDFKWTTSHFENSNKQIHIAGVPLQVGQAKYTGELLETLQKNNQLDLNNTAIILPDENMLFPVLFSIPPSVDPVNVTMGYPLQQSQYQELIKVLYELHRNSKTDGNQKHLFHVRYIRRLFSHPIFRNLTSVSEEQKEYSYFMDVDGISNQFLFPDASRIFSAVTTSIHVFEYIESVLMYCIEKIFSQSLTSVHFEDKIIEFIIHELRQLKQHVEGHFDEISAETAWQMARECIGGLKVPFSGEPVQGLQVMGFLETRALDFKNIIILNANEGSLPASSVSKSFIPFSIRKGYGLSTYEDQDASWSYHFYRLLHHADNIYMLYNSEVSKTNDGEPTRYFLQLKQELKRVMGDRLQIHQLQINTPVITESTLPISISKEGIVLEKLNTFNVNEAGDNARKISSTAITTYIHCSLRFYYKYVAGLKELETDDENIEDRTFGNILHKTLELLYRNHDQVLNTNDIEKKADDVDRMVDEAVKEVYKMKVSQLEGNDILLAEVIRELTRRILENDKKDTPFRITGLEQKLTGIFDAGNTKFKLEGNIDRIDEQNQVVRIIDYKTGNVELKKYEIRNLFENPDKKGLFQLYFYVLLYQLNYPGKPVKTGFYLARNLGSGITWLDDGKLIADEWMNEYKIQLAAILNEILSVEVGFSQTTDLKRCEHCPYKILCNR